MTAEIIEHLRKISMSIIFGFSLGTLWKVNSSFSILFNSRNISVFIRDILFFAFSALSLAVFIFAVNDGKIRIYMLVSVAVGMIICFLTVGKLLFYIVGLCRKKFGKSDAKKVKKT